MGWDGMGWGGMGGEAWVAGTQGTSLWTSSQEELNISVPCNKSQLYL